jgi:Predicted nucleotide-binding protein containing TIR-like domain
MSYRPRVYVHAPLVGNLSERRRKLRTKTLAMPATAGFDPQEFGVSGSPLRSAWTFDQAARLMDSCQGAVILALPKYEFGNDLLMPSEYAHYEGALALAKDLPTLILTEQGVAVDFDTGSTIMAEISTAIRSSRCGIFLFTRDDPLEGDSEHAAPRDNVVFEAGYCMAIRGPRRTIVIRENGAKMPADLGGVIYLPLKDRTDISSIQEGLRQVLDRAGSG